MLYIEYSKNVFNIIDFVICNSTLYALVFIRICVLETCADYEIKYIGGSARVVTSYEFTITSGIVKKTTIFSKCHKFPQKYYNDEATLKYNHNCLSYLLLIQATNNSLIVHR